MAQAGSIASSNDSVLDAAVNELASRLAALPTEYRYMNSGCKLDEFSLFSSSFNNNNEGSGFAGSLDPFNQTGYYRASASYADDDRYTDTPQTWPKSNQPLEMSPNSFSFPVDFSVSQPAFFGGSIYQSTDSGLGALPFKMHKKDIEDWIRALEPPKPGPGYECRICRRNDHYVQNCPGAPPPDVLKTPYQGYNMCFGMFECDECGRHWGSHRSFAQRPEFCRHCQHAVYPYKQYPLDKIPQSKLTLLEKQKGKRPRYRK